LLDDITFEMKRKIRRFFFDIWCI